MQAGASPKETRNYDRCAHSAKTHTVLLLLASLCVHGAGKARADWEAEMWQYMPPPPDKDGVVKSLYGVEVISTVTPLVVSLLTPLCAAFLPYVRLAYTRTHICTSTCKLHACTCNSSTGSVLCLCLTRAYCA